MSYIRGDDFKHINNFIENHMDAFRNNLLEECPLYFIRITRGNSEHQNICCYRLK